MDAAAGHMADAEIDAKLAQLAESTDPALQGRLLAILTALFSQCSDSNTQAVAAAIPQLTALLASDDHTVKSNAVAALTAASALDDALAAAVAQAASQPLAQLLASCAGGSAADLQLNVVAAIGQLARDQDVAAEAVLQPEVLPSLLALADSSRPVKLQEAVADALCALASRDEAREELFGAGAVASVAQLLHADHLEVSVRCLLVIAMLSSNASGSNAAARQQLAADEGALQQLLALLKQQQDADCKVLARDVLALLVRDEELKLQVEAAMRQSLVEQQQQEQQQQQQPDAA